MKSTSNYLASCSRSAMAAALAVSVMNRSRISRAISAVAFIFAGIATQPARAIPFDYFEEFNLFGQQKNFTCPGPGSGGVCGAIAAINSFAFLQNKYPKIYDFNLLPNYSSVTKTDMIDATAFATGNWFEPNFPHSDDTPISDSDIGFYARAAQPDFDPNRTYLDTKMDWISDHVPGNSTTFAIFLSPTIDQLANEIRNQQDVEFFVKDKVTAAEEMAEAETDEGPEGMPPNQTLEPPEEGEEFYHALTLTRVMCDANNNCIIGYQDPNRPTVEQLTSVTLAGGRLEFTGVPGSNFAGTVFIDAAFAESPVPEPSSALLLATGLASLGAHLFRRQRRVA